MGKKKWNKKQWNLLQGRRTKKNIGYVRQNTTEEGKVIIKSNYLQCREKNGFKMEHLKECLQ